MIRWTTLVLLAASMCVVACEEQKPAAGGSTGTQAAAAPLKDDEVPVQADFAEEAQKDITPATYKTEVDALEKEINAE